MQFFRRRTFMAGATGLLSALASHRSACAQQVEGLTVGRKSRLFESADRRAAVLHLITVGDRAITLFQEDTDQKRFGVGAFSFDGNRLWQYSVPSAFSYGAIGTAVGGKTILLHALNLRLPNRRMIASCLLALDPVTGSTNVMQDLTEAIGSRFFFAGDGNLLAVGNGVLRLWNIGTGSSVVWTKPYVSDTRSLLNVEVIQEDSLALVPGDGSRIQIVSRSTGAIAEYMITSSEIDRARADAQSYRARTGTSDSVQLPLIPVTGTNGNGIVYGLVYPIPSGQPASIIGITGVGQATRVGQYRLPADLGHPRKIVIQRSEIGIGFVGGAVAWYAA